MTKRDLGEILSQETARKLSWPSWNQTVYSYLLSQYT
jgi:hypothetical protein